jgi:hypothetical protein
MEKYKRIRKVSCLNQYAIIPFFLVSLCRLSFGFYLNFEL